MAISHCESDEDGDTKRNRLPSRAYAADGPREGQGVARVVVPAARDEETGRKDGSARG